MKKLPFPALVLLAGLWLGCKDPAKSRTSALENYRVQGDSIVRLTFDSLRALLVKTMQQKGPEEAVRFCKEQAIPVTSLYAAAGISVQRVAERNRNPSNALDSLDRVQWENYVRALAQKDSLQTLVLESGNTVHYYKPILLQPFCVSCHGDPVNEIGPSLKKLIDSLYPGDKATGFKPGELRGLWHLTFRKKE